MAHPQAGAPAGLPPAPGEAGAFAWNFAPELILPLAAVAIVYAFGWWRLTRRGPRGRPPWRLAAAGAGWLALAAALLSPLASLGHVLFSAHMVQHLLLMAVAAPLLLLADPLPAVLWGLPRALRHRAG